ncbi:MAG: hypothetical protein HRT47_06570 [Candidatus Caenarcaniphilales bacterium]|nr:hypothetical protein [Candidatus Caenarcaniphilales bacterium]
MDNNAKEELAKLSSKYKKFLLTNKNKELITLNPEYTLKAIQKNLDFPLDKYISEENLKSFNRFNESVKILGKIAKEHKLENGLASLIKHAVHKKKQIAIIDNSEELGVSLNSMFINLDNVALSRDFMEGNVREEGVIKNGQKEERET